MVTGLFRRWKQEAYKLETSLGKVVIPYLKNKIKTKGLGV
jgi:hypothetical protein